MENKIKKKCLCPVDIQLNYETDLDHRLDTKKKKKKNEMKVVEQSPVGNLVSQV